jgi:hypothetical protein
LRKTTLAAVAAALLAAPTLARADVLAGGPIYGDFQQDQFAGCFLFNAGPTAVALSGLAIVGPNGQPSGLSRAPPAARPSARASSAGSWAVSPGRAPWRAR